MLRPRPPSQGTIIVVYNYSTVTLGEAACKITMYSKYWWAMAHTARPAKPALMGASRTVASPNKCQKMKVHTHSHTHTHIHADSSTDLPLLLDCLRYQRGCPSSQRQALTTMAAMCTRSGQHQAATVYLTTILTVIDSQILYISVNVYDLHLQTPYMYLAIST